MKRKVVLQKVLATVMALSMAAGVSISNVQLVKADDSDPFAFDSVSDVTFPLKEKLNLTVFVNAPTTGAVPTRTTMLQTGLKRKQTFIWIMCMMQMVMMQKQN